jgi:hypothetical protein
MPSSRSIGRTVRPGCGPAQRLHEVDSPQNLGDWLADSLYIDAMRALGHQPILHIGQAR